jgi:hypothetical protein
MIFGVRIALWLYETGRVSEEALLHHLAMARWRKQKPGTANARPTEAGTHAGGNKKAID